ncbi:hypothetical protein Fluta_3740 [Fluviicola taffensis DSM 16823]|uniref:Uncharacterized protein n=1 Tax=Fluviicola taffensis (strain DSM 16823 / NCIMB 13979 / RW262) TaxID=755732 RepID=F2IFJ3_FLUTR|nr:hypothetical protein Fluta_3740 [Fluviicola taffensis DSM 16823]
MFRLYIPLVFFVVFVGWFLYRLLIKKDLKKNLNTLFLGLFFVGIWTVIYLFILK